FPKVEKFILKFLKPVVLVVIAGTIALGVYTNIHIFRMIRPMAILAGCLLPYCGYLTGALVSLVTCQTWKHVKTIAIETGIQNTGIAFMMLFLSLPPPDNQLATVGPAASAIMTPQPLFVTVIVYLIYKRCTRTTEESSCGKHTEKTEEEAARQDLVSSGKEDRVRTSGTRRATLMSGGNGKSAVMVLWEKLTGVEKANPVEEMLNRELIVPSPTSTTKDEPSWTA
ncbi:ileal sodium/bile acid cotransporter, partial [Elysia marginata]